MVPRRDVTTAEGHRISVVVEGTGPAVLIVPGRLQSAQRWIDLGYVERLASMATVVVVDPLGHGESDHPTDPADYHPERAVVDLLAVLDALAIDRAAVWGYGTGAFTALDLARRRAAHTSGAILGGIPLTDPHASARAAGIDLVATMTRAAAALDRGDWEAYFDIVPGEVAPSLRRAYAESNDAAAVAACVRAELRWPWRFVPPTIPSLVYWATGEPFADANAAAVDALPLDWATLEGPPDAGFHGIEQVMDAVAPFLATLVSVEG